MIKMKSSKSSHLWSWKHKIFYIKTDDENICSSFVNQLMVSAVSTVFLRVSSPCVSMQKAAAVETVWVWNSGRTASERCYQTSTSTSEDCPTPRLPHQHHPPPHPASTTRGPRGCLGVFLTASAGTAQPDGWTQPSSQVRATSSAQNTIMSFFKAAGWFQSISVEMGRLLLYYVTDVF